MSTPAIVQPQFELRAELKGHLEDVRGCLSCELGIVTASRDKTVKLWVPDGPTDFSCLNTYVGHTDYVTDLAYIPAGFSPEYGEPVLISGSRDTSVIAWNATNAQVLATLRGHAYQVTGVGVLPNGDIVSCALDKTLRVWSHGKCKHVLEGHEGPVLCVIVLPTGDILSGSGDASIRMWSGGRCVNVLQGHTDTVRGLAVLPDGLGWVSGSHDMTCKVWSMSGEVLSELIGHTALVYSVAATAGGLIASGSEDNTTRIWNASGACLQVIEHIGCVWGVTFTAEGDLVTACSDSIARVFTTRPQHMAPAEVAAAYKDAVASYKQQKAAAAATSNGDAGGAAGAAGGGEAEVAGLPPGVKVEDSYSLQQPGTKDGQTKLVREADGSVWAYGWDVKAWQWEKIGEVVSAPAAGGGGGGGSIKKYHNGKEYDYVFDVDIQEGAPTKKLACNRGDNPYIVADQFIEEEGLPAYFKEQIVQFIIQNTGMATGPSAASLANMPVTGGFCDPFTGGSSSSSAPPNNSYYPSMMPAQPLAAAPITGGFVDPFTGGNRPIVTQPPASPSQPVFLVFDNVPPIDKLAAKVRELSSQLPAGSHVALTEEESQGVLPGLLSVASSAVTSQQQQVDVTAAQQALLLKLLQWPAPQLFPAFDILRLLVTHKAGAALLANNGSHKTHIQSALRTAGEGGGGAAATQQTALRFAANGLQHASLQSWLAGPEVRELLLDGFAGSAGSSSNKALRLSWATLLYNFCVLSKQKGSPANEATSEEVKLQVLSALIEAVSSAPLSEPEPLTRGLSAAALLLGGDKQLAQVATDLGIQDVLRRIHDAPESKTPAARPMLEAAIAVMNTLK